MAQTKNDVMYYLKALICLAIMIGVGRLPAVEPLTDAVMDVLGIFLGCLFGWCFIGLIWPSIAGLMGLVLVNALSLKEAFAGGWGSTTLLLIFFMIMMAAIVEQSGVSSFISIYFISRKWVLGKPWTFIFIFMCTVFLLSAITSTIPTIIICWSILYGICQQVGYKPYDPFASFMVIGVVIVGTFGLAVFPFKPVGILVFGVLQDMSGLTVDYLTYLCFTIPMGILCIAAFVIIGKFIFRIDVSKLRDLNEDSFKNTNLRLTKRQKFVIGFMFALIVVLLLPSILPAQTFLAVILKKIEASGAAAIIIAIMCCLKVEGEPLMNFKLVASRGMQWDVLFITATTMPLASAIGSDKAGITAFLVKLLSPFFEGKTPFLFLVIAIASAVILTQFAVNNIVGAILLPVFYPFALQLDISPLAMTSLLVYTCHFALLTPAASPMAALLHGNSEWVHAKDIYRYGFLVVLSSFIISCAFGIPYVQFLFQ